MASTTRRNHAKILALKQREEEKWKQGRLQGIVSQTYIRKYGNAAHDRSPLNNLISKLVKQHLQQDGDPNSKDLEARIERETNAFKARESNNNSKKASGNAMPTSSISKLKSSGDVGDSNKTTNWKTAKFTTLSRTGPGGEDSVHPEESATNNKGGNWSENGSRASTSHRRYQRAKASLATDWSLLSALSIIEAEDEVRLKQQQVIEKRKRMKQDLEEANKAKELKKQLALEEERKELRMTLEADERAEEEQKRLLLLKAEKMKKEKKAFIEIAEYRQSQKKKEAEEKANSERIEMERILKEQELEKLKAKEKVKKEKARLEADLLEALKEKERREKLKQEEYKLEMIQAKEHQLKLDKLLEARAAERQRKLDHAFDAALITESKGWTNCFENIPERRRYDTPTLEKRAEKQALLAEQKAREKKRREEESCKREQERIIKENSLLVKHQKSVKSMDFHETVKHNEILQRSESEAAIEEKKQLELEKLERVQHMKGLAAQVEANRLTKVNYNMTEAERMINKGRIQKLEEIAKESPSRVSSVLVHFPQKGSHHASLNY